MCLTWCSVVKTCFCRPSGESDGDMMTSVGTMTLVWLWYWRQWIAILRSLFTATTTLITTINSGNKSGSGSDCVTILIVVTIGNDNHDSNGSGDHGGDGDSVSNVDSSENRQR